MRPLLLLVPALLLTACQGGEVGSLREENVRLNAELANLRSELQAARLQSDDAQATVGTATLAAEEGVQERLDELAAQGRELAEQNAELVESLRALETENASLREQVGLPPEFVVAPPPPETGAAPVGSGADADAEPLLAQARSGALHSALIYRSMEDPMYSFDALAQEYADCSNVTAVGGYPVNVGVGLPCTVTYIDEFEVQVSVQGGGERFVNGLPSSALGL